MLTGYIVHVHARRALCGQNGILPPALHGGKLPCRRAFANGKSDRKSLVSKVDEADAGRLQTGPTPFTS
jgi:hypothetical protein